MNSQYYYNTLLGLIDNPVGDVDMSEIKRVLEDFVNYTGQLETKVKVLGRTNSLLYSDLDEVEAEIDESVPSKRHSRWGGLPTDSPIGKGPGGRW